MSLTLGMMQQEFVQAMRMGDAREQTLHIVVVRLLAIALMVTGWRQPQDRTAALPVPEGYRTWPVVESQLESRRLRQRFRLYVGPHAATLSDDQPFPVGTAFVVETVDIEVAGEPLVSRFVMERYADVTTGESDRVQYGVWASATYGSAGAVLPMDETACAPLPFELRRSTHLARLRRASRVGRVRMHRKEGDDEREGDPVRPRLIVIYRERKEALE